MFVVHPPKPRRRRELPQANEAFAGPYLFEASAALPDSRIVGNRSIICVNDYLLTQKRTPTKVHASRKDVRREYRGRSDNSRSHGREHRTCARSHRQGRHRRISKDRVFPKTSGSKAKNTHLFIADTATGPALQFAEATAYSSGTDSAPSPNRPHAEIITDRNLYRPGHTVKMKGLARDVTDSNGLTIPVGASCTGP